MTGSQAPGNGLAVWASDPQQTRGRRHPERPVPPRNDFQRDRDRIVHSTGFRRLVYKTQVFLNHEGDLFRTRLTHSLEVAQFARAIARALHLAEDLCEAISLAHDLGHTPFGHAGQDALDDCLRSAEADSIGFEHNFQSLRVVDVLEERYPAYDGLNLCFETREGILKHCSRRRAEWLENQEPGGVGQRFLERRQPSLEAQICNLADRIAYNAHDIDDGVRSGLLVYEQLLELPFFVDLHREVLANQPELQGSRLLYAALRAFVSSQVDDVIATSSGLLAEVSPADAWAARQGPPLIAASAYARAGAEAVQSFLRQQLYRHPQVVATTEAAKAVVRDLYEVYEAQPLLMPTRYANRQPVSQGIADYVSGMTDRFALKEHHRLTGRLADWSPRAIQSTV